MARRTGSADLPLHAGRVPPWLATRMASLGAVIAQAIAYHYGRDEFLQRLAAQLTSEPTDAAVSAALNAQLDALTHVFLCDSAPNDGEDR